MISRHVRRVDQLDSVSLDAEHFALLNAQYRKAITYIPSNIVAKTGPEFDVLFRFMFKYMPLKYLGCTFGQNVFDLKYFDSDTLLPARMYKLCLLTLFSVSLPWFWERVIKRMLTNCPDRWTFQIFETSNNFEHKFVNLWKILSLINFCVFLQKSMFPTVAERILRIRPVHSTQQEIRLPQYDGISRELLWHGLSEFLGFTLPLINIFRTKNYLQRVWFSLNENNRSKYRLKNDNCLICDDIPNFPHSMGCAHIFCYYCIASMLSADPYFTCMHCKISANGLDCIKAVPINRPDSNVTQK